MLEKIVIFYPTARVLEALRLEAVSFVSIDEDLCVSNFEKGQLQKRQALSNFMCNTLSISEIEKLYSNIDNYSPVFSRWEHKAYEHELLKEEILIKTMRLRKLITDLQVTKAVFLTSSSHHLDTYTFELALNYEGIPQIFLYAESITGRLLPMIQFKGLKDRSPLTFPISDFTYENEINSLITRNYILPETSIKMRFSNLLKRNITFTIFYLIIRKFRQIFRRMFLFRAWSHEKYNFTHRISETMFSDLRIIKSQYQFLKAYKLNSIDTNEIEKQRPILVIMAHLQPEATSFPEGGRAYRHLALVSHLRQLGYKDPIYFKEHWASCYYLQGGYQKKLSSMPSRVGINRDAKYCDRLMSLNCNLLPLNSRLPSEANAVVVTISGSVAIERALKGYVTIYSGVPYWKGLPGTFHINELPENFETVPQEWVSSCPKRAKRAKSFLLELLNKNTISNEIGIGLADERGWQPEFLDEFRNFIKNLIETKKYKS